MPSFINCRLTWLTKDAAAAHATLQCGVRLWIKCATGPTHVARAITAMGQLTARGPRITTGSLLISLAVTKWRTGWPKGSKLSKLSCRNLPGKLSLPPTLSNL